MGGIVFHASMSFQMIRRYVQNRGGAGLTIGMAALVQAPADGYTLVNVQSGSLTIAPTLYPTRIRYDPERDLLPITYTVKATFILTVAAAESAIGLAILVLLFRNKSSIRVDELNELRG